MTLILLFYFNTILQPDRASLTPCSHMRFANYFCILLQPAPGYVICFTPVFLSLYIFICLHSFGRLLPLQMFIIYNGPTKVHPSMSFLHQQKCNAYCLGCDIYWLLFQQPSVIPAGLQSWSMSMKTEGGVYFYLIFFLPLLMSVR